MRERSPVGDITRQEVRQPTDREVREAVSEQNRDVDGRVELARAERCGDSRVAAAHDEGLRQAASSLACTGSRTNWYASAAKAAPASGAAM